MMIMELDIVQYRSTNLQVDSTIQFIVLWLVTESHNTKVLVILRPEMMVQLEGHGHPRTSPQKPTLVLLQNDRRHLGGPISIEGSCVLE